MVEFWTTGAGIPGEFARRAERAERDGFDGITIVDSQNLAGDCYVYLALAAHSTSRLKLATGVTNPFTRHAAVTATAIMSVQAESQGRAVLGIGRGDSALAHLGYAPVRVDDFREYLEKLQGYLRGESVVFDDAGDAHELHLANRPIASRIRWAKGIQKVPVDVAATGPRVIRMAAVTADQVTFALGADPARLEWGIQVATNAREAMGFDPGTMPFGAYINVVAHPDAETARELGEGGMSLFVRFSAMHGDVVGPASPSQRQVFENVHRAYDMTRHSRGGSPQAAAIPNDFAREFGIFGSSQHCIERINALVALGIERLVVVGPSAGADTDEARQAAERFRDEVMPAVRAAHPA